MSASTPYTNGIEDTSTTSPKAVNILFVCLGNICRSPMAHAVFAHRYSNHPSIGLIDSAGTGAYHAGDLSDSRTLATLEDNGIADFVHPARKVTNSDFEKFDILLGMDAENYADLMWLRNKVVKRLGHERVAEVAMFGEERFGGRVPKGRRRRGSCEVGEEIDDPYYGGAEGFQMAYEQCMRFSEGLIGWVEHGEGGGKSR